MSDASNQQDARSSSPSGQVQAPVTPSLQELLRPRNSVQIEVKAHFELDDARIFDLNGSGLKVTVVTEN